MYTDEELDKLAEELYDWCCARREDNLDKNGNPGDPRKIGSPYPLAINNVKVFYIYKEDWQHYETNTSQNKINF